MQEYQQKYDLAFQRMGLEDIAPRLEGMMRNVGFENVRLHVKKLPLGMWAKGKEELGRVGMRMLEIGVKSYGLAPFTRELGMTQEEAEGLAERAFAECAKEGVHTYMNVWFVEGNKPAA